MAERAFGEAYRNIRLCVDSYADGVLAGRYSFPGLEPEDHPFRSLTQFLTAIEAKMDETGFPQSFTARRTFAPIVLEPVAAGGPLRNGDRATFLIRIAFRQHASWQGSVTWLEGRGEQNFRSVLELILLMNSALTAEEPDSEEGGGAVS